MSKDDVLQALRLTAMGRVGHPLQDELAEKLAELFAPAPAIDPSQPLEKLIEASEAEAAKTKRKAK